jgi:hypothetical protein
MTFLWYQPKAGLLHMIPYPTLIERRQAGDYKISILMRSVATVTVYAMNKQRQQKQTASRSAVKLTRIKTLFGGLHVVRQHRIQKVELYLSNRNWHAAGQSVE